MMYPLSHRQVALLQNGSSSFYKMLEYVWDVGIFVAILYIDIQSSGCIVGS